MARPVKCFYCGKEFDREKEPYTIPRNRRYAHKQCGEYAEKIHREVKKNLGSYYIKAKVDKDISKMLIENQYSIEDIYGMCLYWFYEQTKTPDPSKSMGGIGILPYIAPQYFMKKEKEKKNLNLNKNKHIKDYVDAKGVEVNFILPPIRKPIGKNFFNLR